MVTVVLVRSARLLSMSLVLEYTKESDVMSSRKMSFVLFSLVYTKARNFVAVKHCLALNKNNYFLHVTCV
jgi:hypothetical protein